MRQMGSPNTSAHRQCLRTSMLRAAQRPASRTPLADVQRPDRHLASRCRAQAAAGGGGVEAIVLVDHGSKRAEANAMLDKFAELYRYT